MEYLLYIVIAGVGLWIWAVISDKSKNDSWEIRARKAIDEIGGFDQQSLILGIDPDTGFKGILAISSDYEKMVLSKNVKQDVEQTIITPNQLIEFEIKTIEGETVTQMTGGGTAVTVAGGLAFGALGALVGASSAKRETTTAESTQANLELVYTGGPSPHFTLKVEGVPGASLEQKLRDVNARVKIFMSKKAT